MDAALQPARSGPLQAMLIVVGSLLLHGILALLLASYHPPPPLATQQVPIEIAVIERTVPPPPLPAPAKAAPAPQRVVRARRVVAPTIRPPELAPPPPSEEAREVPKAPPLIVTGITMGSTSSSGSFAVGAGNTLSGAPRTIAVAPSAVKPYKAERYVPVADLSEPPAVVSRADLKDFYPQEAQRNGFEGDVQLRLLLDGDGSLAKVELVKDPGQGLGEAGLRAIRKFRFRAARLNGASVATTITFVLHFLLK